METAHCPICGSAEFIPFMEVPDRFDSTGEKRWKLVRSVESGLIMLNPRPEASGMEAFYPSGLYDPHLAGGTEKNGFRFSLAARRMLLGYRAGIVLKYHEKPLRELSILEVGCSTGDLLGFLNRKKGIPVDRIAGIETNNAAAQCARNRFGLEIHPAVPRNEWKGRKFDRIVLWHTLEHIHAAGEMLDMLFGMLRQDGLMVIALPNPASTDAAIYGENWIAWDAPRHLYHFTPGTTATLLEKHNLNIFRSMPYFPDTLYNLAYSEKLACRGKKKPFDPLRLSRAVLKTVAALPGYCNDPSPASGIVYFARGA